MKLLYVYDKGANCDYWNAMLRRMKEIYDFDYKTYQLKDYLTFNGNGFDVMVYQTFPDESHRWKFEHDLVKETDKKFLSFDGYKILFDSRDGSNDNGFPRFGTDLPRIKHVGGEEYSKKFNVIFIIPGNPYAIAPERKVDKNILVHYAPSMRAKYPHNIRREVLHILADSFFNESNFTRISKYAYLEFLQTVLVSVTVPGYGDTSAAAYYTLSAGTCLLVHEWVKRIKLFPHSDLIDGEDFVSFNTGNLEHRLRELLNNRDMAITIGESGRKKFIQGMDMDKSCKEMYSALEKTIHGA